jgi:hypothetical protein
MLVLKRIVKYILACVVKSCILHLYGVFKKEFYSGIPNVTVWRVLRKRLHLNSYKLYIVQVVERWIVFMPLSMNVFVTLATQ